MKNYKLSNMNLTIYLAVVNFISHFLNYFISRLYIRVVHLNLCIIEYFKSANLSHSFLLIKNAASNVFMCSRETAG